MPAKLDSKLLSADFQLQQQWLQQKFFSEDELLQQQLQAIEIINPQLNAFLQLDTQAKASHGKPLSGLAVAVKDNIDVAGFNTSAGLEVRRHHGAASDAYVVSKLRQAGAAVLGKLNMHEGALGASNHNSHFGDCHNPHRHGFTPGGSSGGSAAAVAAGLVPIALGTDTMGSVRIPASYCGVFGFKPSRGAVSNQGSVPCGRVMDTIGPLARSARDLTLAFDYLAHFDPNCAQAQVFKLTTALPQSIRLLIPDDLEQLHVSADIIADFQRNLEVFVDMGCSLTPISLSDYPFAAMRRAGLLICESDMRVEYQQEWQHQQSQFSEYLRQLLSFADTKSAVDYSKAQQHLEQAQVTARKWFARGDFLLLPTTPQRAFSLAESVPANQADLTSFANQAGLPALSLPMLTAETLPAGMQLVGPSGSDRQLLALAERWQQHSGFRFQLPQAIQALVQ